MGTQRRRILALALPASLEMGFQMLLGVVDLVMIGHLGDAAVGGVGLVNTMVGLSLLALGTVGAGGAVLVAQWFGAGDHPRVARYVGQMMGVGLAAGIAVGALFGAGGAELLALLGADAATARAGGTYLSIVGAAFPLALLSVLAGECLRAMGDARTPLRAGVGALAANTVLNALLIFGPGPFPAWGVEGAALATVLARAAGALYLLHRLARGRADVRPGAADLRPDRARLRELAAVAWPVTVGETLWVGGTFAYTVLYTRLGPAELVASQVMGSLELVFIMTAFGLGTAAVALVGQELGAGRVAAARRAGAEILRLGLWLSAACAVLLAAVPAALPWLYPKLDPAAATLARDGLLVAAAFLPVRIVNMIFGNGILRGGGDAAYVMRVDGIVMYAVGVPVALLGVALGYGFLGVLAGRLAEEAARLALLLLRWRGDAWARVLTAPAG